jgi:hypothetical protein
MGRVIEAKEARLERAVPWHVDHQGCKGVSMAPIMPKTKQTNLSAPIQTSIYAKSDSGFRGGKYVG